MLAGGLTLARGTNVNTYAYVLLAFPEMPGIPVIN